MESLERRENPSTVTTVVGTPWVDANALTLSFAPDNTPLGADKSKLFEAMKSTGKGDAWQLEALRAFQTWAAVTNANVAVVADSGDAFGVAGDRQGDNRFGDIRIGATALSADSLANAVPSDPAVGTWSGDVLFNTAKRFAVGRTGGSGYDVYTTALHEAGHVFGLDHSADPASAITEGYTGVKSGLTAADIAGVQAVYGVRTPDRYEGATGNDTFATATALSPNLYQVLTGDLTRVGDANVFSFTVPAGADKPTVTLRTAGISSAVATIEVYDSTGKLVAKSGPTDPLRAKDFTLTLSNAKADTRYFARVSSPSTDVFAVGRYLLTLNLDSVKVNGSAKAVEDRGTNETIATASELPSWSAEKHDRFRVTGKLEGKADVDAYRLTAPVVPASDALQIEVRNLRGNRTAPDVKVYDGNGNPLVVQVLESGNSKTTLQVLGMSRGATYFVVVRSPDGTDASGDYQLTAAFTTPVVRGLTQLDSGVLNTSVTEAEGRLVLDNARLVQLSLNVSAASLADSLVTLQVFRVNENTSGGDDDDDDDDGGSSDLVGEWTVNPLTGQVNGAVLLPAGEYQVVVSVSSNKGQSAPPVRYWLFGAVSSDPIGPTAPTTGTLPGTTSPPPARRRPRRRRTRTPAAPRRPPRPSGTPTSRDWHPRRGGVTRPRRPCQGQPQHPRQPVGVGDVGRPAVGGRGRFAGHGPPYLYIFSQFGHRLRARPSPC